MKMKSSLLSVVLALAYPVDQAPAQGAPLSLPAARAQAQVASADVQSARAAVAAASALATQAGAYPNPTLSVAREATARGPGSTSQLVAAIDQRIEMPGLVARRRRAALLRHDAATARLSDAEAVLNMTVARAFAEAVAADTRLALAESTTVAFESALVVTERRLREGDVSGFAARRIRLEAARYLASRAAAAMEARTARLRLGALLSPPGSAGGSFDGPLDAASARPASVDVVAAAIESRAIRDRPDVLAAALDADAADADARRAGAERYAGPTIQLGHKSETPVGGVSLSGYVAALSVPLPIWDRRAGTVNSASEEARRRRSDAAAQRRRAQAEAAVALASFRAAERQLTALSPARLADAAAARTAAQTAYAEGEITLLEWLDTVRAYQETVSAVATLRAALTVSAAELERAAATPLFETSR